MQHIVDPRHILHHDKPDPVCLAMLDAFDALTNGMENPEAMHRLYEGDNPLVDAWKPLIRAIQALYEEDIVTCEQQIATIPEDSPPAVLRCLFYTWIENCKTGSTVLPEPLKESKAISTLYKSLFFNPHPVEMLAEQAEEALNHAMTNQYERLVYRILRMLQDQTLSDGPLLAVRYAVYCLKKLNEAGYATTDFFSVMLNALGHADGFFALGISLLEQDPEAAQTALQAALEADDGVFVDTEQQLFIKDLSVLLSGTEEQRSNKNTAKQMELF